MLVLRELLVIPYLLAELKKRWKTSRLDELIQGRVLVFRVDEDIQHFASVCEFLPYLTVFRVADVLGEDLTRSSILQVLSSSAGSKATGGIQVILHVLLRTLYVALGCEIIIQDSTPLFAIDLYHAAQG